MKGSNWKGIAAVAIAGATAVPLIAASAPAGGPVARYDMRAGTVSGAGGGGGGMGMMFGGGGTDKLQHELLLRLGSSQTPVKGSPKGEHFMPPVARLGKSVQLVTPKTEPDARDELPQEPKGRMLIFWGCGERSGKGQPIVIDFSKLAKGQTPPGLWTSTITRDWGPTLGNSRTFARWPSEDRKFVKADSSLIGPHRIVSNYAPEIAFTLAKDFMAPLRVATRSQPAGSTLLQWNALAGATGYLAFLSGGRQGPDGEMGDMVMWTSSASRQFGGGLSDWLSPGQVAALVRERTVLAPAVTSCIIPVDVIRAAPDFRFGMLTGFGPEENFAFPPRPVGTNRPWNPEWTARIRHRSVTSWMEMQGMQMGTGNDTGQGDQKACKPRGLGGMLGGVLGGGGC